MAYSSPRLCLAHFPRKRRIVAALGLSGLAIVAFHEAPPWWSSRQLADVAWMSAATTTAERRAAAHRALGSWVTDAHDAVLLLSQVGDKSSIPHLRAFLARHPNGEGDVVSCTWTHAREALDRLEPPARPRWP
jgi:hypothetical protein